MANSSGGSSDTTNSVESVSESSSVASSSSQSGQYNNQVDNKDQWRQHNQQRIMQTQNVEHAIPSIPFRTQDVDSTKQYTYGDMVFHSGSTTHPFTAKSDGSLMVLDSKLESQDSPVLTTLSGSESHSLASHMPNEFGSPKYAERHRSIIYKAPTSKGGVWVTDPKGHSVEYDVESGKAVIVNEHTIHREVPVTKKIVRECHWERVVVVPEKEIVEEIVSDVKKVEEKIVQYIRRPNSVGVSIPEIEYREKVVTQPRKVLQEKINRVPKVHLEEKIIEVPKIIIKQNVVEVPEYEYRKVVHEKIEEIECEVEEKIIRREVPVTQYVDKEVIEYVDKIEKFEVPRNIVVPVEVQSIWKYGIVKMQPKVRKLSYPVYIPRFIEVPVPSGTLSVAKEQSAVNLLRRVQAITQHSAVSLSEVANVAADIKHEFGSCDYSGGNFHDPTALRQKWLDGTFQFRPHDTARYRSGAKTDRRASTSVIDRRQTSKRSREAPLIQQTVAA